MPDKIITRLDEHFDGVEFAQFDGCNPDNVAINSFTEVGTKEEFVYRNLELVVKKCQQHQEGMHTGHIYWHKE
ncbi:hypothetical protein [Streptococcus sinensis]|uniref:hypothetical protein n=1 Tax=Streptococcus sinensis TaxID=176090 RepID=UPI001F15883B|nr:hypothetical protein [Streptococcus sinensis]MCF1283734.1 hypothetical protein [Streptococcus sinensis]